GRGTREAYLAVRETVETILEDRSLDEDLRRMRGLVAAGDLVRRVEAKIGSPLRRCEG
ncbi:MAG: hypothetical protein GWN46_11720, partial [Gammaproteobacteria bacterium]|nr:hypothetical protein [Gammaproteobacteria bacterium]